MLEGEKVRLRPIQASDIATARSMINDSEVRRYLYMQWPISMHEEQDWYARRSTDSKADLVMAITDKAGRHIGMIGLHNIDWHNGKAVLGIQIGVKSCQNKGFGREALSLILDFAFGEMNLDVVQLETFDYNERAQRCYLATGFRKDGVHRSKIYNTGKRRDLMQMSVTRDDWLGMRGKRA